MRGSYDYNQIIIRPIYYVFTMLVLSVLLLLREKYLLAYVPRVLLYYSGRGVYNIETDMSSDKIKDILANMTGISLHYTLCNNS